MIVLLAHGSLPGYWDEGLFIVAVILHAGYLFYIWWDGRRAASEIDENTADEAPEHLSESSSTL